MQYPIDVNILIGLIFGVFAFGLFSLYSYFSKPQVKLEMLRFIFPQRNYGTADVEEKGGNIYTYIVSYIPAEFKVGDRTFIFPVGQFIPRRWGAPYTHFYYNDGSNPIPTNLKLQTLVDPTAKPGTRLYGQYVNLDIGDKPNYVLPRTLTSYLVQLRGLDREVAEKDRVKPNATPLWLILLLFAIFLAAAIGAFFAYQSNSAATFCANGVSYALNITKSIGGLP